MNTPADFIPFVRKIASPHRRSETKSIGPTQETNGRCEEVYMTNEIELWEYHKTSRGMLLWTVFAANRKAKLFGLNSNAPTYIFGLGYLIGYFDSAARVGGADESGAIEDAVGLFRPGRHQARSI